MQCEKTYLLISAPNEDSNQPAYLRSLITVFHVRMKKLVLENAPSEDSDQTARKRNLIRIFAGCTSPKVRFLTLRIVSVAVPVRLFTLCSRRRCFVLSFYVLQPLLGAFGAEVCGSVVCVAVSGLSGFIF